MRERVTCHHGRMDILLVGAVITVGVVAMILVVVDQVFLHRK